MPHLRLSEHINKCLSEHGCVAIPEIGGFVVETIPARYDHSENRAYPPTQELHFNAALCHRDGLLERFYASAYGFSLRRARIMLEEDIKTLRADLVGRRSVYLRGIGQLDLSEEGLVSFCPESCSDRLYPDAYGLYPASLPLLKETPLQAMRAEAKSEKYYYLPIHKRVPAVAAAMLIFTVLFFLPFDSTTSRQNCEAGFIPTELVAGKFWNELSKQQTEGPRQDASPATPGLSHPHTAETQQRSSNNGLPIVEVDRLDGATYFVVVGSFRSIEQVEDFVRQSKEEASTFGGVIKDKRWYRIFTKEYRTSGEAYTAAANLKGDAWVFAAKK